jgi:enterobactin synthetase component F
MAEGFGLLASQEAVWLDSRLLPGMPVYTTGQAVFIAGEVDPAILARAITLAVAESDALGIRLQRSGTTVRQVPQPAAPVELPIIDLTAAADPEEAARAWMATAIGHAFAWDAYPLFRFALLRLGPARNIWFQAFHHLVTDAAGREILTARVAALYTALRHGTQPQPHHATPYAEARRAEGIAFATARARAAAAYWRERLANLPAPLLDADRQSSDRSVSGRPARSRTLLDAATFDSLRAVARDLGTTAFPIVVALVHIAFARLYETWDLVSGLALDNRAGGPFRATIGLFTQIMPFRATLARDMALAQAIEAIGANLRRDYRHRRFPAQNALHAELAPKQRHPRLFDLEINYITTAYDFDFDGAQLHVENLSHGFLLPWLITVADRGPGHDVEILIDTDSGLVAADEAPRIRAVLGALFTNLGASLATELGAVAVMDAQAEHRVAALAAPTTMPLPPGEMLAGETLVSMVEAQARRTPTATAVLYAGQRTDYRSLQASAERLAGSLAAMGLGRGAIVGIALPRTPDMIVAVLATLRAGAAYLPLDPGYPAERLAWMIADSGLRVVVTNEAVACALPPHAVPVMRLDVPADLPPAPPPTEAPLPDDLAYVLYTSGSTGLPKPVGVEHRNVVNLIRWARSVLTDDDLAGFLLSTSLNFDLSVFEIFTPLAFGGQIILVETLLSLADRRDRASVRLINTGPSLLATLLSAGLLPPTARTVIVAGERLTRGLAEALFAVAPTIRLLNCYGPTETTVYSTWAEIRPGDSGPPSIGRGITNTELHVLDAARRPLPPGAPGELWIGGAGVARGYLARPDLTAERFIDNRHGTGRLYRTGDLVRWDRDDNLAFIGRDDGQLKINGIRVEPGEIEAALLRLPGVGGAAVLRRADGTGTMRLLAWLTPRPGAPRPSADELSASLARVLPPHMVPADFGWLPAFPLTPNGKLDRRALAELQVPPRAIATMSAPAAGIEDMVAAIWREALHRAEVPTQTDFFDAGGDSLSAVLMLAQVEALFGVPIAAEHLTGDITVSGLARIIDAGFHAPDTTGAVTLQPAGEGAPFFCVPGLGGDPMHLRALARRFGTVRPFIALRAGPPAEGQVEDSLETLARRFAATVIERQPEGAILLGGYSGGAWIAFEMARQLTARGRDVALLAVIDSREPGWRATLGAAPAILVNFLRNLPAWVREDLARSDLRQVTRNIRRTLRWTLSRDTGPERVLDLERYTPAMQEAIRRNFRQLQNHRQKPWAAEMLLLRCTAQPLLRLHDDLSLGWGAIAGSVKTIILPGNHLTIMREPLVASLAEVLNAAIAAAGQGPQPNPASHPASQ